MNFIDWITESHSYSEAPNGEDEQFISTRSQSGNGNYDTESFPKGKKST